MKQLELLWLIMRAIVKYTLYSCIKTNGQYNIKNWIRAALHREALDIIDSIAFIFMKWSQGQKMCLQFIYILSRGTFKHVICKKDG